ncbi:hypothetical protein OUZ56_003523 [Daphnia magna]|uniref:Secreted protein n=1 Tax=Daphnia magna TaxID=35525 RepID=A0ABR0A903_9CRUS|nr:hypothetical protein OUZ56_003523 [Daphnia magna]
MLLLDFLSIRSLIVQVSCLGKAFVCSNRCVVDHLSVSDLQNEQYKYRNIILDQRGLRESTLQFGVNLLNHDTLL